MFKRWFSVDSNRSCLILGPRRAGKTTFVRQNFPDYNYATLDDLDYLDWARKDPKGFVGSLGKRAIIDEIQRVPKLTIAVKYAIDNLGACFVMTGSSSINLLDSAADTLAGRIDIHFLPTACWGEDLAGPGHSIFGDELDPVQLRKANRLLKDALSFGQFPEILTEADDEAKQRIFSSYKNSYFTRELMQLSNIENLEGLMAILHNLIRSLGSHLEISNFARESGLSHPTTKKYLNTLFQSHLTFRLLGYQFGPAKRHIKAAKTYFVDNGIIHAMNAGASKGQIVENFVIAELEKRRKLGLIECEQFYYYKSSSGREIDLVFESRDTLHAVEIKAGERPGPKDFRNLKAFSQGMSKPVESYLFYTGTEYATSNGIKLIPIATLFGGR